MKFQGFHDFAVFSSMGGPGRPRSHFSTPPQLTITYMYIYVCAGVRARVPRDAVFALPGGRRRGMGSAPSSLSDSLYRRTASQHI